MNDESGIPIMCENCTHHCRKDIDNLSCQHGDFYAFDVSKKALKARISELQKEVIKWAESAGTFSAQVDELYHKNKSLQASNPKDISK